MGEVGAASASAPHMGVRSRYRAYSRYRFAWVLWTQIGGLETIFNVFGLRNFAGPQRRFM
jgi:hypothetical protein